MASSYYLLSGMEAETFVKYPLQFLSLRDMPPLDITRRPQE